MKYKILGRVKPASYKVYQMKYMPREKSTQTDLGRPPPPPDSENGLKSTFFSRDVFLRKEEDPAFYIAPAVFFSQLALSSAIRGFRSIRLRWEIFV